MKTKDFLYVPYPMTKGLTYQKLNMYYVTIFTNDNLHIIEMKFNLN